MDSQEFSIDDGTESLSQAFDDAEQDDDDSGYDEHDTEDAEQSDSQNDSESKPIGGRFTSQEELLQAYEDSERRLMDHQQAADNLLQRIQEFEQSARTQNPLSQDRELFEQLHEAYKTDPLSTIDMMIRQAAQDHWAEMEHRFAGTDERRQYGNMLSDFLARPGNGGLKAYSPEFEHLVLERGMHPEDASALIQSVAGKQGRVSDKRSAAAKEIRNRSILETGGKVGRTGHGDGELDRALKKTASLEDMFEELRKIKL